MSAYNLTSEELLLVYLTFLARDEENHAEYFTKWFSNGGSSRLRTLFNSLKEKNIIHKNYNPETYNPNDIEFNKNFIKSWIKNSGKLGQELFEEYPPFIQINGKIASLRNISKKFYSLDEFYFYYSSAIGHSIDKHKEVMELLQWGKTTGKIKYSCIEFVASRKWEELKLLKDQGVDSVITDNSILLEE